MLFKVLLKKICSGVIMIRKGVYILFALSAILTYMFFKFIYLMITKKKEDIT